VLNKTVLYLIIVALLTGLLLLGAGLGNSVAINNLNHSHQAVNCRNCHGFQSNSDGDSASARQPQATAQCLGCHTDLMRTDSPLSLFHELGDDCADCHSFHQPKLLTINGDTTTIALAHSRSELCIDCHKSTTLPEVSPGHREAARLLHGERTELFTESPSGFCLACHDVSSSIAAMSAGLAPPRLHMAAGHPYDTKLIPGYQFSGANRKLRDEIDPSIRISDGNITCISCHSLTSRYQNLLVASIEEGLCTECHDMQRTSTTQPFTQNE
jgi:predicted CXXCH cytochrome family protein